MQKVESLPDGLTQDERIEELDRLAKKGRAMPALLTQAEQFFFLSVRSLCVMARAKLIPEQMAVGEYKRIKRQYETAQLHEDGEREALRRRNKAVEALTQAVHQDGCPRCRDALKELLGLK